MMKRFSYILLLIAPMLILSGCKKNTRPFLFKEKESKLSSHENYENIDFNIEKIAYSKSYQNISPKTEVIKQGLDYKLLVSLGLVDSTSLEIEKITQNNMDIDIYVKNKDSLATSDLLVPQLLVTFKDIPSSDLDKYKYKIINTNYEPILLKLDANEAINIISSNCQISSTSYPDIHISQENSRYFWTLEYNKIFDKSFTDSPIIDLKVKIDGDSGEILESNKIALSNYIDKGHLLDSISKNHLIYIKKEVIKEEDTSESLWSYNIEKEEKRKLFTSPDRILSAKFNSTGKYIGILESSEKNRTIYIIKMEDYKAYRINLDMSIYPELIEWKDDNNLYIVYKKNNRQIISNYNVESDDFTHIGTNKLDIMGLELVNDLFLIYEKSDDDRSYISLSRNFNDILYRDSGLKASFINNKLFAYIKKDYEQDLSQINLYDLGENKLLEVPDYNISNYFILSESKLALIEKNPNNRIFTLHEYDFKNKEGKILVQLTSDKILLNPFENMIYVNSNLPFEENDSNIIYSIDMKKFQ